MPFVFTSQLPLQLSMLPHHVHILSYLNYVTDMLYKMFTLNVMTKMYIIYSALIVYNQK